MLLKKSRLCSVIFSAVVVVMRPYIVKSKINVPIAHIRWASFDNHEIVDGCWSPEQVDEGSSSLLFSLCFIICICMYVCMYVCMYGCVGGCSGRLGYSAPASESFP